MTDAELALGDDGLRVLLVGRRIAQLGSRIRAGLVLHARGSRKNVALVRILGCGRHESDGRDDDEDYDYDEDDGLANSVVAFRLLASKNVVGHADGESSRMSHHAHSRSRSHCQGRRRQQR